jgi:bacterioferritin-associated ferredoxin
MYVCICRAVTDRQLRLAIDSGACTRRQLAECLDGIGRVCGKCNSEIKAMIAGSAPCGKSGECGGRVSA